MSKNLKAISAALILLIGLLSLSVLVSADSNFYSITKVKVNDVEMTSGGSTTTQVELDESTEVEVYIDGTGNSTFCPGGNVDDCTVEVRVKAWIGGYEYDDIEASSGEFDIEPGVSYKKTLTLEIPADLDVEDNEYTLYIEVYDSEDSEREDFGLFAERSSHNVKIVDVIYDNSIDAGETSSVEVRVENLGEDKEEDIKVEVSLAGDSSVDYINELAAFEENNEDEESSDSATVTLNVDADLECDYYDLTVKVSYNRGHDTLEETYKVWIECTDSDEEAEESGEAETKISISSSDLEGKAEEETSLTLTFTNSGSGSEIYSVHVNGEEQWADSDVSPESVTVAAGESQEVTVTLTPNDDASGDYEFSLQILNADDELQEEVDMEMSVEENEGLFGDTNSILKVGFIILIVLIIIIGLIVAFRKLKDDDEDELEPKEGQTYY
ncbi:MAG: NEW3 domain-containing protein [bacterium]|nr:NEW3 domain-containing protein [bacterium]